LELGLPISNIGYYIGEILLLFVIFAAELKVDRFVLLATTGKNAKNPFLSFGNIFTLLSILSNKNPVILN
jgi:hypothetical protein